MADEAETGSGEGRVVPDCEAVRVRAGKHRDLQMVRTGGRKLFDGKAQADFLEWFAATCNVSWSAELAGFNYKTVLRHRMNDALFAEAWNRALGQGYARLEAQQLETERCALPIGVEGDRDAPPMPKMDPMTAATLLREHKRSMAGVKKPGRAPRAATNEEVIEALAKRLAQFGARAMAEKKRGGLVEDADPAAAQPAPPPPFGRSPSPGDPGEDL